MFKKWAFNETNDVYTGTYDVNDKLPSGMYVTYVGNFGEPVCRREQLKDDDTLNFVAGPLPRVISEINTFWNNGDKYKKMGLTHKRGILLYGPPGCGKTGIIISVVLDIIKNGGIAFKVDGRPDRLKGSLPLFRQIERGRPIVAVMEDIEQIIDHGNEEQLLEVLDGTTGMGHNIVYLATTNKIRDIPARIKNRPSRIDTLIEVTYPEYDQRYEYLKFLLLKDDKNTAADLAHTYAEKSEGFSLAALKELVISTKIYGRTIEEAVESLREIMNEEDDDSPRDRDEDDDETYDSSNRGR